MPVSSSNSSLGFACFCFFSTTPLRALWFFSISSFDFEMPTSFNMLSGRLWSPSSTSSSPNSSNSSSASY